MAISAIALTSCDSGSNMSQSANDSASVNQKLGDQNSDTDVVEKKADSPGKKPDSAYNSGNADPKGRMNNNH